MMSNVFVVSSFVVTLVGEEAKYGASLTHETLTVTVFETVMPSVML